MPSEFLRRARARILRHLFFAQLAFSGALFFAALVLVLVFGSAILNGWTPLVLALVALIAGCIRAYRRAPSLPVVAQRLDRRCNLADALSTALHFEGSSAPFALPQRAQALAATRSIDLRAALPFAPSPSLYVLASLALVAVALFWVRYGVRRDLSLAPPIARFDFDPMGFASRLVARMPPTAPARANSTPDAEDPLSRLASRAAAAPNAPAPQANQTPGANAPAPEAGSPGAPQPGSQSSPLAGQTPQNSSESRNATGESPSADPSQNRDHAPNSGESADAKSPNATGAPGLMSKLRDAVSSLMSKMKRDGAQTPASQPSSSQASKQAASPNAQKGASPSNSNAGAHDANSPAEQPTGDSTADSDSSPATPAKGAGNPNSRNASAKPGSGMGNQDGAKELREAEQLAAMGKLSQIIGKRSSQISGEMTIEPQSGPQQLQTGYTRSNAHHGEAGGDVRRDEVPLALQSYVQQYFEQVRKQPIAPRKPAASSVKPAAAP